MSEMFIHRNQLVGSDEHRLKKTYIYLILDELIEDITFDEYKEAYLCGVDTRDIETISNFVKAYREYKTNGVIPVVEVVAEPEEPQEPAEPIQTAVSSDISNIEVEVEEEDIEDCEDCEDFDDEEEDEEDNFYATYVRNVTEVESKERDTTKDFIKIDTQTLRSGIFMKLSPAAVHLFLILARHIDKTGKVNAETSELKAYAKQCHINNRYFNASIVELKNTIVDVDGEQIPLIKVEVDSSKKRNAETYFIDKKVGFGIFDNKNSDFEYQWYITWNLLCMDELLKKSNGGDLLTLLNIAAHMDKTGKAYPSRETLAQLQDVTTMTITRNTQSLEEGTWLSIGKSKGVNSKYLHNVYTISKETGLNFIR